jgi:hypothetical protein
MKTLFLMIVPALIALTSFAHGFDIFNEDFEDYDAGDALVTPWVYTGTNSDNGLVADTEAKAGDNSLYFYDEADNSWGVYYDPPSPLRKGAYKFSVYFPAQSAYLYWYQSHEDGTGIRLLISPASYGGVYYYYNSTRYVHWDDVSTGTWHDIEIDFDHTDGADGTFDIYWNGDKVCTGAAIDGNINNKTTRGYFAAGGSDCEVYIDNYSLSIDEETELYFDSFEDTIGEQAPEPWQYSVTNSDNGLECDTESLGGDQSVYFYDEIDNSWAIYRDPEYSLADGKYKFSVFFPNEDDSYLIWYQSQGSSQSTNLGIRLLISPAVWGGVYDYLNATRYLHWDNIATGTWHDIEIAFDHTAGSNGTFDIYFNDTKICTAADIDAENDSKTYRGYFGESGSDCEVYIDNYSLSTSAADALPGYYVTAQKGRFSGGDYYTKVCMYTFDTCDTSDTCGTVTQRYWLSYLDAVETFYGWGLSDRTVGDGEDTPPGNIDETKKLIGLTKHLEDAPGTVTGDWTLDGRKIHIDWNVPGSVWEKWYITWEDPGYLYKIELYDASYLYSGTNCYLTEDAVTYANGDLRDTSATTAGWGFGSSRLDFTYARPAGKELKMDLDGIWIHHSTYENPAQQPIVSSSANFDSDYHMTDNNVLRNIEPDDGYGPRYFYYAPPVTNSGILARRLIYQAAHDFDRDGHIEDNGGHVMGGLQIIDNAGNYRGAVMNQYQATNDSANSGWVSALFWLDVGAGEGARTGVLPE